MQRTKTIIATKESKVRTAWCIRATSQNNCNHKIKQIRIEGSQMRLTGISVFGSFSTWTNQNWRDLRNEEIKFSMMRKKNLYQSMWRVAQLWSRWPGLDCQCILLLDPFLNFAFLGRLLCSAWLTSCLRWSGRAKDNHVLSSYPVTLHSSTL